MMRGVIAQCGVRNMTRDVNWVQAFAVLRAPEVLAVGVDLNLQIKAVSVWHSQEEAVAEVERLAGLKSAAGKHYWWQSTHLVHATPRE